MKLEPHFQYKINDKTVGEYYTIKNCCCFEKLIISSAWSAWLFTAVFIVIGVALVNNSYKKIGTIINIEDEFQAYVPWSKRPEGFCPKMREIGNYTSDGINWFDV